MECPFNLVQSANVFQVLYKSVIEPQPLKYTQLTAQFARVLVDKFPNQVTMTIVLHSLLRFPMFDNFCAALPGSGWFSCDAEPGIQIARC